jgi:tetratricopeptide (TPR) repeat protein
MLGDFYFASGDLDKAVGEYASIYKDHPNDLQAKKNYIQLLILKNRADEASKLTDEVLKTNPNDTEALIYRGQIQVKQGNASDAAETLQQAVRNAPDNGVAHYHLGVAFDQMGNAGRAEQEWRDAARLRPDLSDAQRALATVELRNGSWESLAQTANQMINKQLSQGEADLTKAMQVAPQSPVGFIHMGNLRLQQKKFAEAEKYFEQALTNDPNAADALSGVANVFIEEKQPDKAVTRINAQIARQPSNSNFHYLLGAVLFNQKDYKGAEAELRRAVELDKNNPDARMKLGQVQLAEGQVDQAIATYQDSIKESPRDVRYYILCGELYESQKKWDQAKDIYQKALQVQPDNPLASNNLAYVMLEQGGNVDVALSMAQAARRGMPQSPNAADTLGWAYYQKGAYGSAVDLFKEAIKLSKENNEPTYYYHLALAYQKEDQRGLARQQLERALKINPTFNNADDARRILATLKE